AVPELVQRVVVRNGVLLAGVGDDVERAVGARVPGRLDQRDGPARHGDAVGELTGLHAFDWLDPRGGRHVGPDAHPQLAGARAVVLQAGRRVSAVLQVHQLRDLRRVARGRERRLVRHRVAGVGHADTGRLTGV